MSVILIKNQLMASLNAMQSLKIAYEFASGNIKGEYPFATLTTNSGSGKFADTTRNFRKRGFQILVYQEQTKVGQGAQNAEDIITTIIDELELHLDMNTTLSGTCNYVDPIKWKAIYDKREADMRVLQIDVTACELVPSAR